MVIELGFFKKKMMKMENMDKMSKSFFRCYVHIASQHNQFLYTGYFSHILHLDIIKSKINFKLRVKMNKIPQKKVSVSIRSVSILLKRNGRCVPLQRSRPFRSVPLDRKRVRQFALTAGFFEFTVH